MKINDGLAIAVAVSLGLITIAYAGWGGSTDSSEPGRYALTSETRNLLLDTQTGEVWMLVPNDKRDGSAQWYPMVAPPNNAPK